MATEIIIVDQNETTGAATIEVIPVEQSAAPESISEIVEAIFDSTPETPEANFTESHYSAFDTTTSGNFDSHPDAATSDSGAASVIDNTSPVVEAATETPIAAEADNSHANAATDAQAQADEAVAKGDYEAASHYREVAENEAWNGGDSSMLHGSNSTELDDAHWQQQQADYYETQEAQHAQSGDYEAAKEDATNAAYHNGNADWQAGGSDHTGQAQAEAHEMDWAGWEEGHANYYAQNAETYAAQGDYDQASHYAEEAAEHQATADYHGDLGEHGGSMAVYDPASDVSHDTSYSSYDYASASYDTSTSYSE